MWRSLRHPNVLPLMGVTMTETRFAMISDWMVNGNINDFVKARPGVDRIGLVGFRPKYHCPRFIDNRKTLQLIGVSKGLIYIHGQGMIHGDLKGVCLRYLRSCSRHTDLNIRQGKHSDRPSWKSPPCRLRPAYHHIRPHELFLLELVRPGWHGPVDGSGTHRPATVRVGEQPPDKILRLLCSRDGDI